MAIITAFLILEAFLLVLGLSGFAYTAGAGSENFRLSTVFVLSQICIILVIYWRWYIKANREAAELYNIEKMRKAAFRYIPGSLLLSVTLTGLIAAAGMAATFLQIIFVDINRIFCVSAMLSEFLLGNLSLLLVMRTVGLPDRVLGRY